MNRKLENWKINSLVQNTKDEYSIEILQNLYKNMN